MVRGMVRLHVNFDLFNNAVLLRRLQIWRISFPYPCSCNGGGGGHGRPDRKIGTGNCMLMRLSAQERSFSGSRASQTIHPAKQNAPPWEAGRFAL